MGGDLVLGHAVAFGILETGKALRFRVASLPGFAARFGTKIMNRLRPLILALAVATASFQPTPAWARQDPEEAEPGETVREGLERMMRALERFIDMIPQYEVPELTDDGDIIIRRKRDDEPSEPEPEDRIDRTRA